MRFRIVSTNYVSIISRNEISPTVISEAKTACATHIIGLGSGNHSGVSPRQRETPENRANDRRRKAKFLHSG
ncbi:hypothetical protein X798_06542, partial [Onchocerca flexuosa]